MKVAFATLGCKVNQYDTAVLETVLLGDGTSVVPFGPGADVYVINSCAVTDRAEAESRQIARRARRYNPTARVVLTGCFAQATPGRADIPEVDHVVGVGRLHDLLAAVRGELAGDAGRVRVSDLRRAGGIELLGAETFRGQTRAFLKVQEGCDLFCTFCIVPFSRGRSRSVEPRRVMEELRRLADKGFEEVVLTGIHLGGYGRDLSPSVELATLLEMIEEAVPVPRIRLSSIDPPEVTGRLLGIMARSKVLCPHLHVPVQAASDSVLRRMRRQYDMSLVRDVLAEVRTNLPGCGVGTDVIAGFPGETDEEFEVGMGALSELPFTYFHVFPYSRRSGTTAARLSDQLPAERIRTRAEKLRRLGDSMKERFAASLVGTTQEVLVEASRERGSGWLVGYGRNYSRFAFPGPDAWMGRRCGVVATGRQGVLLVGEAKGVISDHGPRSTD